MIIKGKYRINGQDTKVRFMGKLDLQKCKKFNSQMTKETVYGMINPKYQIVRETKLKLYFKLVFKKCTSLIPKN